jgi:hypothetical protein
MPQRFRLFIFLIAVVSTLTLAGTPSASATDGLICGVPEDPIPCSTFNTARCVYSYNPATNCCVAQRLCVQYCC